MKGLTESTKTISAKDIDRKWHLIDVKGKVLGRIASQIVILLTGKQKTNYSPNIEMGDNIVVVNARQVVLTGRKAEDKKYSNFSGYPGGMRSISVDSLYRKNPAEIVRHAVSGMLPKNKLRDKRLARLHIFADDKHPFGEKFANK